jgi:hypothetical protein
VYIGEREGGRRGCFCFFAQEEKKKGDGRNVDFPLPSLTYDDKTSL